MRIRRRRPALPPAPVNVRVELADGRTVPVELVYTGLDGGLHVWEMTLPHVGAPIRRVEADLIPPRTRLIFAAGP